MAIEEEAHEAWLDVCPVQRDYPSQEVPACGESSPTGRMLCDLPATSLFHWCGQHVGIDRHGNLRGWPDKRAPL